jgi:hypothetical protein
MKIKLILFLAISSTIILFSGCATSNSDKLPAGDIDIYKIYSGEIATLQNTTLSPNSELKYEAALTLYKNVDFSFVRELPTLEKIFGTRDVHLGKVNYEKQTIIYLYRYKNKRVRFVFMRYNNTVIHSESTDLIK